MKIYLKEKIGKPELFSGRKKELELFQRWIEEIPNETSKSRALLSRRKTGKTALMQRLYNLTFAKPNSVIPFYYEVKEGKIWAVDFCKDFFLTFLYQYIAYKTRKLEYIDPPAELKESFSVSIDIAQQEGLAYLGRDIRGIEAAFQRERVNELWLLVRDAPRSIATRQQEFIVQMIDEFQYLTSEITRDPEGTQVMTDFPAGYMSTAEYRNAPLLISGSYIGWLRGVLRTMLPSRFREYDLKEMPEDEALELVRNYARLYETPITQDVAYAMATLCEGNPFYVSMMFESDVHGRDLTTRENLMKTLEYETLHPRGYIRNVWMEYLWKIFYEVNQQNAKRIVLYLCQHRDREVGRDELQQTLKLDMPDDTLEQRLHALVKADIIEEGRTNFDYRGVQDNIFDKVFRGVYQKDIDRFDPQEIRDEYKAMYAQTLHNLRVMTGKYSQIKGQFAEFAVINHLRLHAKEHEELLCSITRNLPQDFHFADYAFLWSYKLSRQDQRDAWLDVFARAADPDYSLIGEIKYRQKPHFSLSEAEEFAQKAQALQEQERLAKTVLFVFCLAGFAPDTLAYFDKHGIAYSNDERWLG